MVNQIKRVPITPAGYEKMREEIRQLKSVDRSETVIAIETARAHGDLKENAEYHAAKERMSQIVGRLQFLEEQMSLAEVIDPSTMVGNKKIMFGAHVTLVAENNKKVIYQIVGDFESDAGDGKISVNSPIARALIGKVEEDEVQVKTPMGVREFEILSVEYK